MTQTAKQKPLIPAYLIVGEDALKRSTVLRRLRERLAQYGDLSFNSDTFDGTGGRYRIGLQHHALRKREATGLRTRCR